MRKLFMLVVCSLAMGALPFNILGQEIGFVNTSSSVAEPPNDASAITHTVQIELTNYNAQVSITITAVGSGTNPAESGQDFTLSTTTLTFDASETLNIDITIEPELTTDENIEEFFTLSFSISSGTANIIDDAASHIVTITDDPTTLPITLTTFTGKRVGSVIHLAWETASEEQNDYIEVQRSQDGKGSFERLGSIESKAGQLGNSQVPLQYAFTDESPLPGINYYRLKQFDLDGRYEYHKTIAVLFDKRDGKQPDITVFPSVTSDRVNVALPQEAAADGELYITNLAGQVVLRTPFERGMQQENIDVARLPQGHYVITVQTGRAVFTARFVKR